MRSENSETRGGPSNSKPNISGPRSSGNPTTTFSSEIAELMSVKSKHGAGGEFTPNWAPKVRCFEVFVSAKIHIRFKCWIATRRSGSDARTTTSPTD